MQNKEQFIQDKISGMSLEQKVGAVLTLGFNGSIITPNILEYITKYHCGGLRLTPTGREFHSYVDPNTGETIVALKGTDYSYKPGVPPPDLTGEEYKSLLMELKDVAATRPGSLPLHFSYDNEGDFDYANCSFRGFRFFPKPMGLAATGDPKYAYEVAKAIGRQSRSVGMNVIHSPVLDVNSDPRNPEIYCRAYSDKAEMVAEYAVETCKGFKEAKIVVTGKHFPGRGHSSVDAHYGIPAIDVTEETMWSRELYPYRVLIEKGLMPSIMLAHSIYPAIDPDDVSTVSKKLITGLLREKMGYTGVITTDSMTMGGLATRYGVPDACAMTLAAGSDLVLMKAQNELVPQVYNTIMRYVEEGKITESDLDGKLTRILDMKVEYGMFEPDPNEETPTDVVNDTTITDLAKVVADKSTVIVKEEAGALPLSKDEPFLLVEQITTQRAHSLQHAAWMFKETLARNTSIGFCETGFEVDDNDRSRLEKSIQNYDTVVFTCFFDRALAPPTDYINELAEKYPEKKFIVFTNTPYTFSCPEKAGTIICLFSVGPDSLSTAVRMLFGEQEAQGVWPVDFRLD